MTRNDLAPPTDTTLILRLTELAAAVERLAGGPSAAELELTAFTPAKAAELLGKTENWVIENIQAGRIPHTYVGKSPRMTAAHIRWVQAQGERMPNKYAKPVAARVAA
ncbi:hypothetical protein ACH4MG_27555 [Streptomyces sp. NPDC017454]|uniref:hypothetical protein n=1 Tax=Streptomyces sp. NPDC017454 TaxID=3364997 RepID=UPI0037A16E83